MFNKEKADIEFLINDMRSSSGSRSDGWKSMLNLFGFYNERSNYQTICENNFQVDQLFKNFKYLPNMQVNNFFIYINAN